MYNNFADKREMTICSKGKMKSFVVAISTNKIYGKKFRYLPSKGALVKEVEENLGGTLPYIWSFYWWFSIIFLSS
jgi:hypothetical protein